MESISRFRRLAISVLVGAPAFATADSSPLDIGKSVLTIHVGRTGFMKSMGHEHWVQAHVSRGKIDDEHGGHIAFVVDAKNLAVLPDPKVSSGDQAKIQHTMETEVLKVDEFREIAFHSDKIVKTGPGAWTVQGILRLRGAEREIVAQVREHDGVFTGTSQIRQTDFDIRPVSVAGGLVRVKDELNISFSIVPAHRHAAP